MAEPKVGAPYANRRLQKRFPVSADPGAQLDFCHPSPNGPAYTVRVRDVSLSGLSFVLPSEIPGLHIGTTLRGVEARVAGKSFRGDLLTMHLSPQNTEGSVCGGLFYPESDEDLITVRLVMRSLGEEKN